MTPARLGVFIAVSTLVLDQATKLWGLFIRRIAETGSVKLAPFLELIEVWNRGISYGLFQQHTEWGRWLLIAVSIIAAIGFSLWLRRTRDGVLAIALGLLIGGAVGNLIDRLAYGAVFDFIHLHWGDLSWYVFNIADAAIVAGVAGLLYDAWRSRNDIPGTKSG
ncbi:signal peptidase II [Terrarubrum flagellatum]|uniref:signal peptidase II n=1 Tax=Terrirubrum flagellatum TaxID=2895980 RepID=UPI003144E277